MLETLVAVVALSPDRAVLQRKSRTRSANALLAVVDGITRPMRTWSQAGNLVTDPAGGMAAQRERATQTAAVHWQALSAGVVACDGSTASLDEVTRQQLAGRVVLLSTRPSA